MNRSLRRVRVGGILLTALVGAGTFAPMAAQREAGQMEVGAYAQTHVFDQTLQFQNTTGIGVRFGFFVRPKLSLEGNVGYANTSDSAGASAVYVPLTLFLMFHLPIRDNISVLLGPGYVNSLYRGDLGGSDDGLAALAGLRFEITPRWSLRLEGRADFFADPQFGTGSAVNYSLDAGVSYFIGKSSPRDSDGDGVVNAQDRCPDTPGGRDVDSTGCPLPIDSDGDGVLDSVDRCPGTPAGLRIDSFGCPLDVDGDGVLDTQDSCPDTPRGVAVDRRGCPVPPDQDGDGVIDRNDRCPETPIDLAVDNSGCPMDPDRDGVFDPTDQCPSTPAGAPVDETGCQLHTPLGLRCVYFEFGLSDLQEDATETLALAAEWLARNANVGVQVSGHTDNVGPTAFNEILSLARAESVRAYLVAAGIAEDRLTPAGFGARQPIAQNATREGRARNRRAVIHRLGESSADC